MDQTHPDQTPGTPTSATDLQLLQAWRAGDRSAGDRLFGRHFDSIYAFFRNKVTRGAEDLVQETFLRCVRGRDTFRDEASFRTFLFVVARNQLYSHLRRRARRGEEVDFETESLADLGVSPTGALRAREDNKLLVHALRRLPLQAQIALELYYVQRVRGEHLARVLDVPPGTVRSRLRRGLEKLREHIADLQDMPSDLNTTMTNLERWAAQVRSSLDKQPD